MQSKTDKLSKTDLDNIANLLDQRLDPLATKQNLKESEDRIKSELKEYMHEGIETIMEGIERITEMLAEKERVERLEKWAKEVGEKVGIKLDV